MHADISKTVEVGADSAGIGNFNVEAMLDHIGCYDDHGGVTLDIEGGQEPYTPWHGHTGAIGASIEVPTAGVLEAVITDDGAGLFRHLPAWKCLQAPQVQAGIEVDQAVVTLVDGEAEVYFDNASNGGRVRTNGISATGGRVLLRTPSTPMLRQGRTRSG